jgi:vancomycin aglycone glucosyltransferase
MGFCMAGRSAAELAGIPFHMVLYCPQLLPSREHPPFQLPFQNLPHWLNRVAHRVMAKAMQLAFGRRLGALRRAHQLAPRPDLYDAFLGSEVLLACDPQIAAAPQDCPQRCSSLGAFGYEQPGELAPELEAFLAQGDPPLYLGFGSMVDPTPIETQRMLESVAAELGMRAVLHQSAGPVLSSSERVHVVTGPLSHQALLPRVSIAIHHGGAGTTAAVARAGVPQIIVPHLFDQFFFAKRLLQRGVAPAALPRRKLTAARLTAALQQILANPDYARAARQLKAELAQQNGITLAADWLEARYGAHVREVKATADAALS